MIRTAALAVFGLCAGAVAADGDPDAGRAKAAVCGACHGADGVSVNPEWPALAGQHASYAVYQLKLFRSGDRANALMNAQAMPLSDQDIEDLAAYYAAQAPRTGVADPALVALGQRIYRGGNLATGVSACAACHGPNGHGNPGARMPWIAGQHAAYTAGQLRAYAAGERRSDTNQMMRNVAALMSEAEIEAVASYIEGLR